MTWEELPPALEPRQPGTIDRGGIWTGSVVEHGAAYYLFYTGHDPSATNPQALCLATSKDLLTFERHPDNPLVLPSEGCEEVNWRDPYVFYNHAESAGGC